MHAHSHAPAETGTAGNVSRAFAVGVVLNLLFVFAEVGFGLLANSLALLADAAHNFTDVLGLLLAWGGAALAGRRPSPRRTYGFRAASILAALANAGLLLVAVGAIGFEAIRRFFEPAPVAAGTVLWVASAGVVVNGGSAALFIRGRAHDLNLRGAFLHMAADAAVSLGVVVAALLIATTGLIWLDPLVSVAIALVILWSGFELARDSLDLALHAVPRGIDRDAVEAYLRQLPGVTDVHDLHIWAMSTTETALTAHLVRPVGTADDAWLAEVRETLAREFGIAHPTLQIEVGDPAHPCPLAPKDVV